jgi:hypothetical protein
VIYIAGWGRSGSTLLSYLLGELRGCVPVGEVRYLWRGGLAENELCGCGEPVRICPFWSAVGDRAFGGWDNVDVAEMLQLERDLFARPKVALLLIPSLWPPYRRRLQRYVEQLDRLYRAIQDVSEARFIIDSTKDPPYAFALRRAKSINLTVIHLVRDSRAAAFAWSKDVRRPEVTDSTTYFPKYGVLQATLLWTGGNLVVHMLRRSTLRQRIRYESLATAPRKAIEALLATVEDGTVSYDLAQFDRREVKLGEGHTIRGNPVRFESGYRPIRLDEEWKRELPPAARVVTTALTWPLLIRYGYLGRNRPS